MTADVTHAAVVPVGGRPVRDTFLPFSPPLLGPEEEAEVIDTLRSGWITTGPKSQRFESDIAAYCHVPHVVAVSSCTAALHLALVALGIGKGDEVITTPFTFASTAHAILYVGAQPVFVDIVPDTFNIDPAQIEARITPRTRAILPMDYGGHPCDMDAILDIARRHRLKVVVDAAHSIGARYKGAPVGTKGDIVCFSFYATKNLATGEGGALLTNDEGLARRARILTMYGISDARQIWSERYTPRGSWSYDVMELGFKYNFTDIQASLGLHQLRKLDGFIARRREHAATYRRRFAGCDLLRLPVERDDVQSNHHLFPILLNLDRLRIGRDQFVDYLKADNIGVSVLWIPLPEHTLYRGLGASIDDYPVTRDVWPRLVNLPVSPKATTADIEDAATAVLKIAQHFAR